MILYYCALFASVLMETAKNVLSNEFSKTSLKNGADICKFNGIMYAGSFAVMLVILCFSGFSVSLYTVLMALLFAVVTDGVQATLLRALKNGPLALVNFIQLIGGILIPPIFGMLFLRQSATALQLAAIPLLLAALALVLDLKKENFRRGSWMFPALLSMLCCGVIGILQSIQRASAYADEMNPFLALTFLFILVKNAVQGLIVGRRSPSCFSARSRAALPPLFSGIFMGIVNAVNLYLIGVIPNVIFFPIANGGLLIMTTLAAALLFRERLNGRQWCGIVCGTAAMLMIGI